MTRACDPTCPAPRHGTESAYRQGCRCPDAREDKRIKFKRRKHGRHQPAHAPITGTARRLQALAAIGWPIAELAPRLGTTIANAQQWRAARRATIRREHATQVARLYLELSGTPGPNTLVRERALRWGWARPIDWDDDAIDDPAATPHIDPPPERVPAAVEYLGDLIAGLKVDEIADRYEMEVDSVEQALRRHRERAAS